MIRFFAAIKSFFRRLFGRKEIPLLERRVFFSYPDGRNDDAEESVYYNDSYFFADSYADNPSLTTCSLGLAMASFSSNQLKADLEFQAGNAVDFLKKCGFCEIETPPYFSSETQKEGLAFAMAQKTLKQGKKPFTLIAIGVRGGNYGREWSSNMKIGLGDRHEGFSMAAKDLRLAFEDYIARHEIKGEIRVWVAGYSRAAAVTNLFAHDLEEDRERFGVSDVYAFCFACPATTRVSSMSLSSIRCYINAKDAVPYLPFKQWGYARYGRDIYIKCLVENDDFAMVYLNKLHIFNKQKRFRRESEGVDKAAYLRASTQLMGERVGLNDYVRSLQEPLEEFMCLVDPKLENPYQALTDVLGDAVTCLYDQYGALTLLRMVLSAKTNWDQVLLPAVEKALKDKPYKEQLNPVTISSAVADFVMLLRQDIVTNPNFFLTFFDKQNMASVLKEHDPVGYLNALKALDPKFGGKE